MRRTCIARFARRENIPVSGFVVAIRSGERGGVGAGALVLFLPEPFGPDGQWTVLTAVRLPRHGAATIAGGRGEFETGQALTMPRNLAEQHQHQGDRRQHVVDQGVGRDGRTIPQRQDLD